MDLGGHDMPVEAHMIQGPLGPDTIQIPGDPQRLARAIQGLTDLIQQLGDAGEQLRQADAPEDARGRTVKALSNIAGRTGRTLQGDTKKLQDLLDALQHESDVLTDAQGGLDDLRRRWRDARQDLRQALDDDRSRKAREAADHQGGHGDGRGDRPRQDGPDLDPQEIIRGIDAQIAQQSSGPLERLAGLQFMDPRGGGEGAFLVDGPADQAIRTYRQQANGVVDDFVESIRRVHRADEKLAELLPRHDDKAFAAAEPTDEAAEAPEVQVISRPGAISKVNQEVEAAARALTESAGGIREIRLAMREGRMTPDDERIGSMEGFQRTWNEHLDELREDLDHARKAAGEVADRLREIDDTGARDVRRASRGKN